MVNLEAGKYYRSVRGDKWQVLERDDSDGTFLARCERYGLGLWYDPDGKVIGFASDEDEDRLVVEWSE